MQRVRWAVEIVLLQLLIGALDFWDWLLQDDERRGCQTPLFGPSPDWIRACGERAVGTWHGQPRCVKHLVEVGGGV